MKRSPIRLGFILGLLTGIPVILLAYIGHQWANFPFVPFDMFDFLIRVLPDSVVTFGVDTIVAITSVLKFGPVSDTVELVEQVMAAFLFTAIGGVVGAVSAMISRWTSADTLPWVGLVFGEIGLLPFVYIGTSLGYSTSSLTISLVWFAVIFASWGLMLGWLIQQTVLSEA
ncbi:MAG: hypothetical protein KDJ65_13680 [Anaerolineae bacterium]|nr:hypothetical protein [Anaerolineae bacterium]